MRPQGEGVPGEDAAPGRAKGRPGKKQGGKERQAKEEERTKGTALIACLDKAKCTI